MVVCRTWGAWHNGKNTRRGYYTTQKLSMFGQITAPKEKEMHSPGYNGRVAIKTAMVESLKRAVNSKTDEERAENELAFSRLQESL